MRVAWVAVFALVFITAVLGQGPPLSAGIVFKSPTASPGQSVNATLRVAIPEGLHLQANPASQDYFVPTEIKPTADKRYSLSAIKYPPPIEINQQGEDKPLKVYEGNIEIPFRLTVARTVNPSKTPSLPVRVTLRYQICTDTNCFPPKNIEVVGTLRLVATKAPATPSKGTTGTVSTPPTPTKLQPGDEPVEKLKDNKSPLGDKDSSEPAAPVAEVKPPPVSQPPTGSSAPVAPDSTVSPRATSPTVEVDPTANFRDNRLAMSVWNLYQSNNWLTLILAIMLGGLLLNLTPCVYPIIAITVGFFANQAGGHRGHSIKLGVVYTLSIVLMYSVLGLVVTALGKTFGSQFQSPWFSGFMAVAMFALALAMFDVYSIRMPGALMNRLGGRAGVGGAAAMGMLAGVAAAPCAGPVVLSLIAIVSQLGNYPLSFALFFSLGLGFGLPYLALSLLPGASQKLPRSGDWMVTVKHILGLVVIGVGVFYLRPLVSDTVYVWLWIGFLFAAGAFLVMFDHTGQRSALVRQTKNAIGLCAVAAGAYMLRPAPAQSIHVTWTNYSPAAFEQAIRSNQPVILDFTAKWCQACKELDEYTFSDAGVAEALNSITRLRIDATRSDSPDVQAILSRYEVRGLPTVIVFDGQGKEVSRLTEFESAERFRARLSRAGVAVVSAR